MPCNYSCRPNPTRPVMLRRVRLVSHRISRVARRNPVIEQSFQWICKVGCCNKSYHKRINRPRNLKLNRATDESAFDLYSGGFAWGLFISPQQPLRELERRGRRWRTTEVGMYHGSPGDYFSTWNLGLLIPRCSPKRAGTFPSGF